MCPGRRERMGRERDAGQEGRGGDAAAAAAAATVEFRVPAIASREDSSGRRASAEGGRQAGRHRPGQQKSRAEELRAHRPRRAALFTPPRPPLLSPPRSPSHRTCFPPRSLSPSLAPSLPPPPHSPSSRTLSVLLA